MVNGLDDVTYGLLNAVPNRDKDSKWNINGAGPKYSTLGGQILFVQPKLKRCQILPVIKI